MRTIHKFVVPPLDEPVTIELPDRHKILFVAEQHSRITMWVELDDVHARYPYRFQVIGTGHRVPEDAEHVGSAQVGPFVWHVYKI